MQNTPIFDKKVWFLPTFWWFFPKKWPKMIKVWALFNKKTAKYAKTLTIFYTKSTKICIKIWKNLIFFAKKSKNLGKNLPKISTFLTSHVNFCRPSVGAGGISLGNAYISNSGLTKNYKNGQFFKKKSSFFV